MVPTTNRAPTFTVAVLFLILIIGLGLVVKVFKESVPPFDPVNVELLMVIEVMLLGLPLPVTSNVAFDEIPPPSNTTFPVEERAPNAEIITVPPDPVG